MSGGWTAVLSDACLGRYAGTAAVWRRIEARRGALRRIIPLRVGHGLRLAGRYLACVSTLPLGGAERRLDCWFEPPLGSGAQAGGHGGASPPAAVAVAGGRVLYLREQQELVLRRPGGAPEVIARFAPALKRIGDIDLGPHGATWAEQPHRVPDVDGMPGTPVPAGAQRVVIRSL